MGQLSESLKIKINPFAIVRAVKRFRKWNFERKRKKIKEESHGIRQTDEGRDHTDHP